MQPSEGQIPSLLREVEKQLRQMTLWTEAPPSRRALASRVPFCLDTMTFNQWLQWVFLLRIHALNEPGAALTFSCAIAPLAEVWLQEQGQQEAGRGLVTALKALDCLLSPVQH